MIVNNLNELFIFGTTGSELFPITTRGCFNNSFNGGNGFSPLDLEFPSLMGVILLLVN